MDKTATQQFVDIDSVKDGVIILKNGALRRVILVGGVNFDLKSEEEQNQIINSFQGFINSLDFSIQFFIHSRRLNISAYLNKLTQRLEQETNELLKTQIADYMEFIRVFVENNAIMEKTFFAVVPYDPILPIANVQSGWFSFLKSSAPAASTAPGVTTAADHKLEVNLQQLSQRADQVIVGFNQIGLRTVPLNNEETVELFYNLYNPETVEKKDLTLSEWQQ